MSRKTNPETRFVVTTPESYEANGFAHTRYHGVQPKATKARHSKSSRHGGSTSNTRTNPYPTQHDSTYSSSPVYLSRPAISLETPSLSTAPSGDGTSQIPPGSSQTLATSTGVPSAYASHLYSYPSPAAPYDFKKNDTLAHQPSRNRSSERYPSLPPHAGVGLYPPPQQINPYPMSPQQQQQFGSYYPELTTSASSTSFEAYHPPGYTHQEPLYPMPPGYGEHGGFSPTPDGNPEGRSSGPNPTWPPYDN
ncbi:hypothetical protein E1B28_013830 [Marasmius oreades]|uniref:Uncharacterized protein n=1 Tax=Marasmius oreades TaxID=181124 RepID=A0A9P7RJI9_9AGAR|nr:uncharacterized protein E1B28_013830 [Marasmius oreades]KAG7085289.1 hypothetical protein E1B28_013830 [Marasmius oreades]